MENLISIQAITKLLFSRGKPKALSNSDISSRIDELFYGEKKENLGELI